MCSVRVSNGSSAVTWLRHLSLARGLLENVYQHRAQPMDFSVFSDVATHYIVRNIHTETFDHSARVQVAPCVLTLVYVCDWCRVGGWVSLHMAAEAVGLAKREAQLLGEGSVAFLCLCPLSLQTHTHTHTPEHTYSIYPHIHTPSPSVTLQQHPGNR